MNIMAGLGLPEKICIFFQESSQSSKKFQIPYISN